MQGHGGDWHVEADKMGDIYHNAVFTIAAVDGTRLVDSARKQPFLSDAPDPATPGSDKRLQVLGGGYTLSTPERIWKRLLDTGNYPSRPSGTLDEMGWSFQERLLSTRTVSITKEGIFWDCLHHSASCRRPAGFLGDFSPKFRDTDERAFKRLLSELSVLEAGKGPAESYRLWRRAVQDYTRRKLTYPKDRVIALNGVAQKMSIHLHDEYILGLWKRDMLRSLIWFVEVKPPEPPEPAMLPFIETRRRVNIKPPPITGPSWSWVSNIHPIHYRMWHPFERHLERKVERVKELASVEHVSVQRHNPLAFNHFGGLLVLRGPTVRGFVLDRFVSIPKSAVALAYLGSRQAPGARPVSTLMTAVAQAYLSTQDRTGGGSWVLRDRKKRHDSQMLIHLPLLADDSDSFNVLSDKRASFDGFETSFNRFNDCEVTCLFLLDGGYTGTDNLTARYFLVLKHDPRIRTVRRIGLSAVDTAECATIPCEVTELRIA